jgi:ADP-ribose pyrophosphatase YjhB (NUDIX family)
MKIRDTELKILKKTPGGLDCDTLVKVESPRNEIKFRQAMARAFQSAQKSQLKSLAFAVSANSREGLSSEGIAKIMAQEIWRFLRHPTSLTEMILCLEDDKALKVFEKNVFGYLDHLMNKLSWGPYVTVDAIIELKEGIILIKRSNPPYGWALPGGFVDYGESLEEAVRREAKEETSMELAGLKQFHTYSDPDRDPRFHTIGTVFIAQGRGTPRSGDDAQAVKVVRYGDLLKPDYAFDHKTIIKDYLSEWQRTILLRLSNRKRW